jgi:hypothetical protein
LSTSPQRTKRATLVIGLVVALLGVCGWLGGLYLEYVEVKGIPYSGETLPAACQISDGLKHEAKVSNPVLVLEPDKTERELVRHTHCFWKQTKGQDGFDKRILGIHVYAHTDFTDPAAAARSTYEDLAAPDGHSVPGLGETANTGQRPNEGATEVVLVVRQGSNVYQVNYRGSYRGFFTDRPIEVSLAEDITRKVVRELMAKP